VISDQWSVISDQWSVISGQISLIANLTYLLGKSNKKVNQKILATLYNKKVIYKNLCNGE